MLPSLLRRTAFWMTFVVILVVHAPATAVAAASRSAPACAPLPPADRLLALLPYLWSILVIGLLIGLLGGWLSHRGGDNAWESARQGMALGLTVMGPLLTVLTLLAVLPPAC
ncbi:hypothetical protein PV416_21595 [Streptomyces ipomoeae]|jgi:hypothetical protein|uniref:hypothetical protein n=1 Tax=Streptomyces ipomoeae TaxID=103232 RepID=UPI0029BD5A08|nr:hypothetical protein [Streptomyces ipomoeae]MDX2823627.1 hypothetical protein [Streptomyces ipomoeae]MDX2878707.1 hypothetical protein [Streptomyces ipomoeae]